MSGKYKNEPIIKDIGAVDIHGRIQIYNNIRKKANIEAGQEVSIILLTSGVVGQWSIVIKPLREEK